MPKTIIVVRHGETDLNRGKIVQGHLDSFLNQKGFRQACELAKFLTRREIDIIFSSDLKRAYYTAWVIADTLKKPLISTSLLRERSLGRLQGLTKEEIKKNLSPFFFDKQGRWRISASLETIFEIETNKKVNERLKLLINRLVGEYKNKRVVLVTHGGTIRLLLKLFGLDEASIHKLDLGNSACVILEKHHHYYRLLGS